MVIANSVIISERSFDTTQRGIGEDNSEEDFLWRRVEAGDREMVPEMLRPSARLVGAA